MCVVLVCGVGAHGVTVVGGGVFRCCVPWCGARAAAPVDDADYALRDGSPQLLRDDFGESIFIFFIDYLFLNPENIIFYFSCGFHFV